MIHLRPSGSYRWTRCAAAPSFEADQPEEPDSDEAREGTAAHWVAECVLKGDAHSAEDLLGRTHKNGWLVTPDMVFYVQQFIDMIKGRGGVTTTEQFVRLTDIIAGTLDCSTSIENGNTLYIDDFKYGFKIHNPIGHTQALIYAGAELKRLGFPVKITHVRIGIFQPRAFHPDGIYRTWTITVGELWEWIKWIVARGDECQKPNPIATPGDHCDHCKAAASCVALAHSVYKAISVIEDHRQAKLTGEQLSAEMTYLARAEKILEARKKAIEAETIVRLKRGEHIRVWHLTPYYGHRKFVVSPLTVQALTGIDPFETKAVTPAELERRGASPDIVKSLAQTPVAGHRLAPIDMAKAFAK